MLKKTTLFASLILATNAATAGMVTNDTELLSAAGHEQLSTWLGEDVDLTRIFAKGIDGTSSFDWHDAVDNRGRTFTIMEVFNGTDRHIAGSYNLYSWQSSNSYTHTSNKASFLFNLSSETKYQKNSNNSHQAYNSAGYGVTFGRGHHIYEIGHDIYIGTNLTTGYTNIGHSYGSRSRYQTAGYRNEFMGSQKDWIIGKYETFTLSASTGDFGTGSVAEINELGNTVSNVPVTFAMGSLAMLGLGFGASRRRKSK
jgi:hypothetical protein